MKKYVNLSKFLLIAVVTTVSSLSFASPMDPKPATVTVQGDRAVQLAAALMVAGFQGHIGKNHRSVNVSSLVLGVGIAQHECDDGNDIRCGFDQGAGVQEAKQGGRSVALKEVQNLYSVLVRTVEPILEKQNINNSDSGMGRIYYNYGRISCTWQVPGESPFAARNARCVLQMPNYGY